MSRLEDATEIALMTAWLKKVRLRGENMLTRSGRVEVRHVCLYASQQLSELRTMAVNPGATSGHLILELKEVITDLENLVRYLEGKQGSFSALKDKNGS